jgi:hypothetical protein
MGAACKVQSIICSKTASSNMANILERMRRLLNCFVQKVTLRNYIRLFSSLDSTIELYLGLPYKFYYQGSTEFQRMTKRKEEMKGMKSAWSVACFPHTRLLLKVCTVNHIVPSKDMRRFPGVMLNTILLLFILTANGFLPGGSVLQ